MNPENRHPDFSESSIGRFSNQQQPSRYCAEIEPLIPAHSIGATDPEEAAYVQANLAHCLDAADDLDEFNVLSTRMLYSAPPTAAPPHLAGRLRMAIAASATSTTSSAREPLAHGQRRRPALLRQRNRRQQQRQKAVAPLPPAMVNYRLEQNSADTYVNVLRSATSSQPVSSQPALSRSKSSVAWYFTRALATVAAIALIVSNIALILQNQQLVKQSQQLATQNQQLLAQQESVYTTLTQQNQALILLAAEEPQEIEIFDPSGTTTAQADILWNNSLGIAVVYVRDFPQCESGQKYQLWLTREGERSSGGLFSVDASGMGLLVVSVEGGLDTYDAIGITPEPATGSPGPTSPPIVRGEL